MKQDSMPVEQDGMALAAEAPVLDVEDTPKKVDESAPAEETLESPVAEVDRDTALAAPAPDEELAAHATAEEEPEAKPPGKKNVFSKVWGILVGKAEIVVPLLFVFSLVLGLIIGYSVMGNGPVKDVFDPETWTHIWKLIFG